ncbi:MAG: cellulase family glycosylhydrolase [Kiritimatiellia bacterium]
MPGLEIPEGSPADMSWLNTEAAGKHGFVRVKNGHFADGRGRPLRLYGVNITGDSCFLPEDNAQKLARRLSQWGFNCLRLHFMDYIGKGSIWKDSKTGTLSEAKLAQLDRLIAECAQEGIYINLNLHVGRTYPDQPKIPGSRTFRYGKSLDKWYPPYVAMQEDYARRLLDHTNPYTGNRYADEPAVACIEISNENTMIFDRREDYRRLPGPMKDVFTGIWTEWLREKYGTTDKLRTAWKLDKKPLGKEILRPDGWRVQNAHGAESILTREDGVWCWNATKPGVSSWNLQMQYNQLDYPDGGRYTFRFKARSKTSNSVTHTLVLEKPPYKTAGLKKKLHLKPEWRDFCIISEVNAPSEEATLRLNFSLGNKPGCVEFKDFSLRSGGDRLPEGQSLETGIDIPDDNGVPDVMNDYFAFLIDTEMATTQRLVKFLKEKLGCKMPVSNTQISKGGAGGVLRETTLCDYIDMHGYWEHPHYKRNEKGQATVFRISNTSQVSDSNGGSLANMACFRVKDRPFSVSEYNTPAPNDHGAELFPLLTMTAALQDWDALYAYSYSDFGSHYESVAVKKHFHLVGRANVLAHAPAGAMIFRKGLLKPAQSELQLILPKKQVAPLTRNHYFLPDLWRMMEVDTGSAWLRKVTLVLDQDAEKPGFHGPHKVSGEEHTSDNGMLRWSPADPDGAWCSLNTPGAKLLIGHVGGRSFSTGDVSFDVSPRPWPGKLPAYACISLVALDGKPIDRSSRMLFVASARTENRNMGWNADRTSLSMEGGWGKEPSVSEAVPVKLHLPGNPVKAVKLDAEGRPAGELITSGNTVELRREDQSLWVLLTR